MARKPDIRVSYQGDANYLVRLAQAIELDEKRPAKWRRDRIEQLNTLAIELLQAPAAEASQL